jgi:hypothetical protein
LVNIQILGNSQKALVAVVKDGGFENIKKLILDLDLALKYQLSIHNSKF